MRRGRAVLGLIDQVLDARSEQAGNERDVFATKPHG